MPSADTRASHVEIIVRWLLHVEWAHPDHHSDMWSFWGVARPVNSFGSPDDWRWLLNKCSAKQLEVLANGLRSHLPPTRAGRHKKFFSVLVDLDTFNLCCLVQTLRDEGMSENAACQEAAYRMGAREPMERLRQRYRRFNKLGRRTANVGRP